MAEAMYQSLPQANADATGENEGETEEDCDLTKNATLQDLSDALNDKFTSAAEIEVEPRIPPANLLGSLIVVGLQKLSCVLTLPDVDHFYPKEWLSWFKFTDIFDFEIPNVYIPKLPVFDRAAVACLGTLLIAPSAIAAFFASLHLEMSTVPTEVEVIFLRLVSPLGCVILCWLSLFAAPIFLVSVFALVGIACVMCIVLVPLITLKIGFQSIWKFWNPEPELHDLARLAGRNVATLLKARNPSASDVALTVDASDSSSKLLSQGSSQLSDAEAAEVLKAFCFYRFVNKSTMEAVKKQGVRGHVEMEMSDLFLPLLWGCDVWFKKELGDSQGHLPEDNVGRFVWMRMIHPGFCGRVLPKLTPESVTVHMYESTFLRVRRAPLSKHLVAYTFMKLASLDKIAADCGTEILTVEGMRRINRCVALGSGLTFFLMWSALMHFAKTPDRIRAAAFRELENSLWIDFQNCFLGTCIAALEFYAEGGASLGVCAVCMVRLLKSLQAPLSTRLKMNEQKSFTSNLKKFGLLDRRSEELLKNFGFHTIKQASPVTGTLAKLIHVSRVLVAILLLPLGVILTFTEVYLAIWTPLMNRWCFKLLFFDTWTKPGVRLLRGSNVSFRRTPSSGREEGIIAGDPPGWFHKYSGSRAPETRYTIQVKSGGICSDIPDDLILTRGICSTRFLLVSLAIVPSALISLVGWLAGHAWFMVVGGTNFSVLALFICTVEWKNARLSVKKLQCDSVHQAEDELFAEMTAQEQALAMFVWLSAYMSSVKRCFKASVSDRAELRWLGWILTPFYTLGPLLCVSFEGQRFSTNLKQLCFNTGQAVKISGKQGQVKSHNDLSKECKVELDGGVVLYVKPRDVDIDWERMVTIDKAKRELEVQLRDRAQQTGCLRLWSCCTRAPTLEDAWRKLSHDVVRDKMEQLSAADGKLFVKDLHPRHPHFKTILFIEGALLSANTLLWDHTGGQLAVASVFSSVFLLITVFQYPFLDEEADVTDVCVRFFNTVVVILGLMRCYKIGGWVTSVACDSLLYAISGYATVQILASLKPMHQLHSLINGIKKAVEVKAVQGWSADIIRTMDAATVGSLTKSQLDSISDFQAQVFSKHHGFRLQSNPAQRDLPAIRRVRIERSVSLVDAAGRGNGIEVSRLICQGNVDVDYKMTFCGEQVMARQRKNVEERPGGGKRVREVPLGLPPRCQAEMRGCIRRYDLCPTWGLVAFLLDRNTALIAACHAGHADIARHLVQAGSSASACNGWDGYHALLAAAAAGHANVVVALLAASQHKASIIDVPSTGKDKVTALHIAAFRPGVRREKQGAHAKIVAELIAWKADLAKRGGGTGMFAGRTALDIARQRGHADAVKLLEAAHAPGGGVAGRPVPQPPDDVPFPAFQTKGSPCDCLKALREGRIDEGVASFIAKHGSSAPLELIDGKWDSGPASCGGRASRVEDLRPGLQKTTSWRTPEVCKTVPWCEQELNVIRTDKTLPQQDTLIHERSRRPVICRPFPKTLARFQPSGSSARELSMRSLERTPSFPMVFTANLCFR